VLGQTPPMAARLASWFAFLFATEATNSSRPYRNEYRPIPTGLKASGGNRVRGALFATAASVGRMPPSFTWMNVRGNCLVTKVLNQHLPQYCGACWAFAAISALNDRIKILQGGQGPEIHLSIQHVLNCGTAGTCNGGNQLGVYSWMHEMSQHGQGVAYESVNPYFACSPGNPTGRGVTSEGFCPAAAVAAGTTCEPINVARNCATFGEGCTALSQFPNATISAYGVVHGEENIMVEVYRNGPVACSIDAEPIITYAGGVVRRGREPPQTNHVVSIIGWGEEGGVRYWIARNSWGEPWGEMGFFRVERGLNLLNIESECAWAEPGVFTTHNFPCHEDGANCRVPGESNGRSNSSAHVHNPAPYGYGEEPDEEARGRIRQPSPRRILQP